MFLSGTIPRWISGVISGRRRGCGLGQHFGEHRGFFQILFGGRSLLVPVIVIAVAGAAAHFRRLALHQRNHRMVGQPAALHAKIIDHVSEPQIAHTIFCEYITIRKPQRMPQTPNGAAPFHAAERKVLAKLTSPERIQRFMDRELTYNLEPQGETCRSPRLVLRDGVAHCMEGALMAAAALRCLGHPPLLVDMEAVRDHDHVLTVYRLNGRWGALAMSDYSGLRSREPVYRTIRELVMSYFEHYYNPAGEKTLRAYSRPVGLTRFDPIGWMT